jgi:hypothetical protein
MSLTLKELVGTLDLIHGLCMHMIINNRGYLNLLRDWALAYFFGLLYLNFLLSFINYALFILDNFF